MSGGYPFYGQSVGVLVFNGASPRVPGDAGHAATFSYPVHYEIVNGSFSDLIEENDVMKQQLIDACLNLKKLGITAAVGDCGMMSLYQDVIGKETGILYAGSSLIQIPLIWQMIGRSGTIGIITGHSELLSLTHLINSGVTEDMNIRIQGLQDEPHFREIVIEGGHNLDPKKMEKEIIHSGLLLKEKCEDLKAIVLECSNLPTYANALRNALQLPVFDIASLANLVSYGSTPPRYL